MEIASLRPSQKGLALFAMTIATSYAPPRKIGDTRCNPNQLRFSCAFSTSNADFSKNVSGKFAKPDFRPRAKIDISVNCERALTIR